MPFHIELSFDARDQLAALKQLKPKKHRKVLKTLAKLETNPKHPGLNSHRYEAYDELHAQRIWESYAENKTPGAYRVFWHYGPNKDEITILAITPHP
jgi:hypothetical protein